jgi:hypothetical protein
MFIVRIIWNPLKVLRKVHISLILKKVRHIGYYCVSKTGVRELSRSFSVQHKSSFVVIISILSSLLQLVLGRFTVF